MATKVLLVVGCLLMLTWQAHAEQARAAVSANFVLPMQSLITVFERMHAHEIKVVAGSSAKFYAQILNGAPFQVFLSADQAKPEALEKRGLTVSGSRFTYARGALALWSVKADFWGRELEHLEQGKFTRLALANPKLAPYGRAASEVLAHLHLLDSTRHKWVLGENIAQAYQFVHTANAQLGLVALAQVKLSRVGRYWQVPAGYHQPIKQDAVLLAKGRTNPAAKALLAFMQTEQAQDIIRSYGYEVAE